jgi:hypothetical protein
VYTVMVVFDANVYGLVKPVVVPVKVNVCAVV